MKLVKEDGETVVEFEQNFLDSHQGKLAFDIGLYAIYRYINRNGPEKYFLKGKTTKEGLRSTRKLKISA